LRGKNPTLPTSQGSEHGTRLAASLNEVKKEFSFSPRWSAKNAKKKTQQQKRTARPTANPACTDSARSMFSTYYLVICGRASARSLHAASATLESRLDSTKQIIPQILCPAQRVGLPVIAEVPFVLVDRHNEDPSADCHNRGWL